MPLVFIDDPADPRIEAYRDVRERDLTGRRGLFVAEGAVVLRTLAGRRSLYRPRSLLLARNRVAGLSDVVESLPPEVEVFVAEPPVMDAIAGFAVHRGVLALGEAPSRDGGQADLRGLLADAPAEDVVLVACGVGNHDNMGALFRNAAALGARAVLLDGQCCDPFYRKAIRVSTGAVLRTPLARGLEAGALVDRLAVEGYDVLALTPGADLRLSDIAAGGRQALVVGAEGPGLPAALIARCRPVAIPMAGGVDSLNVATAAAIALNHLLAKRGSPNC